MSGFATQQLARRRREPSILAHERISAATGSCTMRTEHLPADEPGESPRVDPQQNLRVPSWATRVWESGFMGRGWAVAIRGWQGV